MPNTHSEFNDVRGLLQYVPQFRGRVFVLDIDWAELPDSARAEVMLDVVSLQAIGVKLMLVAEADAVADLLDWGIDSDLKLVTAAHDLTDADAAEKSLEVVNRGQAQLLRREGEDCRSNDALVDLAAKVGAAKLILLRGDEAALGRTAPGTSYRVSQAERALEGVTKAYAASLEFAVSACKAGVPRVHILSARQQGVLVAELFSNEGVGVMVYADSYRNIRALKSDDIPELLSMIGRSVRSSRLVPRCYEDIEAKIGDYSVLMVDDNVVGCVALHRYDDGEVAEIACLYVKLSHEGSGYGQSLVEAAEQQAKELGVKTVFALTNRAAKFFQNMEYQEVGVEAIPAVRKKALENSGRESQVFTKVVR